MNSQTETSPNEGLNKYLQLPTSLSTPWKLIAGKTTPNETLLAPQTPPIPVLTYNPYRMLFETLAPPGACIHGS